MKFAVSPNGVMNVKATCIQSAVTGSKLKAAVSFVLLSCLVQISEC